MCTRIQRLQTTSLGFVDERRSWRRTRRPDRLVAAHLGYANDMSTTSSPDDPPIGEGAAAHASDVVDPHAQLVDLDGAQQMLQMTVDEVIALVEDGTLAPAPATGEDLKFRVDEVEAVRIEHR